MNCCRQKQTIGELRLFASTLYSVSNELRNNDGPDRLVSRASTAARQLLRESNVTDPPVRVDFIAERLGLTVVVQAMETDLSGMLLRSDEDGNVIGVNRSHSISRRRFTIAHELGHYLLHKGRPVIVDPTLRINFRDSLASLATDREEIEANQFAAELLMPTRLVREVLAQLGALEDEAATSELAGRFQVSVEAMTYRLINLGLSSSAH
jgi:Zn-dependent peptidase ImmA (M78 family)